jgi:hypothetical protein
MDNDGRDDADYWLMAQCWGWRCVSWGCGIRQGWCSSHRSAGVDVDWRDVMTWRQPHERHARLSYDNAYGRSGRHPGLHP